MGGFRSTLSKGATRLVRMERVHGRAGTVVLLHMDGANGGVAFPDATGRVWTPGGNITTSTVQSRFGGASALCDGAGDYLKTPYTTDLDFGVGDFCIEVWIYPTAVRTYAACICGTGTYGTVDGGVGNSGWFLFFQNDRSIQLGYGQGGAYTAVVTSPAASVALNAMQKIEVSRTAGVARCFINGVLQGSAASTHDISYTKNFMYVGSYARSDVYNFAPEISFAGYIDEMRIQLAGGNTANYTPETAPFSNT